MKGDILDSALKEVQVYGEFTSHKADIDAEDLSWILQILSTNLYSDPIGSLIREYSSNAWDANVEAGKRDKPIEVGIQTSKDHGSYWYVTDLGIGLSPNRIETVYKKFGKSTKRDSNEAIGMMGLGKFSGLSYSNEVFITTRIDGLEYEYLMHKSEGTPQIDLLSTKTTSLPSGTTIKIIINGWSDKQKFLSKTKEQLAYFENVYFNIDDNFSLNDSFKILRTKTMTTSTLDARPLRLKVGPVTYPIDWAVLDNELLSDMSLPGVAINFNIGEIAVTPNRESILYNKQTLENIKVKLKQVENELLYLYKSQTVEYTDINTYITALQTPVIMLGTQTIYASDLLKAYPQHYKIPRLKGLPLELKIKNKSDLFCNYSISCLIHNGRKQKIEFKTLSNYGEFGKDIVRLEKTYVHATNTKYLCEQLKINNWIFIKKHSKVKLNSETNLSYTKILRLDKIPKQKWRETIKIYQDWQDTYVKENTISYDDYEPSKNWIKLQKGSLVSTNLVSMRKNTGKVLIKYPERSNIWGKLCIFRDHDIQISTLPAIKKYIIYGTLDDKAMLEVLYAYSITQENMQILITAKSNHKYLETLPNSININSFILGKVRFFSKLVSEFKVFKALQGNLNLYNTRYLLEHLDKKAYNTAVDSWKLWNQLDTVFKINREYTESFMEQLMLTAEKNNMFNSTIDQLLSDYKKYTDTYAFLNSIKQTVGKYNNTEQIFAVYVAKTKKIKLDLNHYIKHEPT